MNESTIPCRVAPRHIQASGILLRRAALCFHVKAWILGSVSGIVSVWHGQYRLCFEAHSHTDNIKLLHVSEAKRKSRIFRHFLPGSLLMAKGFSLPSGRDDVTMWLARQLMYLSCRASHFMTSYWRPLGRRQKAIKAVWSHTISTIRSWCIQRIDFRAKHPAAPSFSSWSFPPSASQQFLYFFFRRLFQQWLAAVFFEQQAPQATTTNSNVIASIAGLLHRSKASGM